MRGLRTDAVGQLALLVRSELVVMGDLVLQGLLQGARDDDHAARIGARCVVSKSSGC